MVGGVVMGPDPQSRGITGGIGDGAGRPRPAVGGGDEGPSEGTNGPPSPSRLELVMVHGPGRDWALFERLATRPDPDEENTV